MITKYRCRVCSKWICRDFWRDLYICWKESAVTVRLPPYGRRMDRQLDKWKGERDCSRPGKDEGWNRAVRWVAERLRQNYLLSCVFIFRVITNEVNRNRTKLILLSVEKSHRRLSVHPRPRSFRPRLTATRCDATRVCHSYTAPASCGSVRRFRRW